MLQYEIISFSITHVCATPSSVKIQPSEDYHVSEYSKSSDSYVIK